MQTVLSKSGERKPANRYDSHQLLALIAKREKRLPAAKREVR